MNSTAKILTVIGAVAIMSKLLLKWKLPESGKKFEATIKRAEDVNKIPENLLARLLYQESRFRPDIISGQTKSPAGAVGIAQIVPRWHPTVNPLDPIASINYAANYLRQLHSQFGSWGKALAAYNWGPGNLKKYLAGTYKSMPEETQNYVHQILGDVF